MFSKSLTLNISVTKLYLTIKCTTLTSVALFFTSDRLQKICYVSCLNHVGERLNKDHQIEFVHEVCYKKLFRYSTVNTANVYRRNWVQF